MQKKLEEACSWWQQGMRLTTRPHALTHTYTCDKLKIRPPHPPTVQRAPETSMTTSMELEKTIEG